jgi:predicted nucleic acid-binding protein
MKVALDTNVLVYAEGCWVDPVADPPKTSEIQRLLDLLPVADTVIPFSALPELFGVLRRKGRFSADRARSAVVSWMNAYSIVSVSDSLNTLSGALQLSTEHGFTIMDAMILFSAIENDCDYLLTEDLGHGTRFSRVTVLSPFKVDVARSLGL